MLRPAVPPTAFGDDLLTELVKLELPGPLLPAATFTFTLPFGVTLLAIELLLATVLLAGVITELADFPEPEADVEDADEEESLGIGGREATLLAVGAFGKILERESAGVVGVLTPVVAKVD